jgi:hypothetical protein
MPRAYVAVSIDIGASPRTSLTTPDSDLVISEKKMILALLH